MIDMSKLEKIETHDDVDLQNRINIAISYLSSTDWYVIRLIETGKAVPKDIQILRDEARSIIK